VGETQYETATIDELATKGRERVETLSADHREKAVLLLDAFVAQAKGMTPEADYRHMSVDELQDERKELVAALPENESGEIDSIFGAIAKQAGWRDA
jgi:hypothetical protein